MRTAPLLLLLTWEIALPQPPPKLEFEVASIRPSAPSNGGRISVGCTGGPGSRDPGLFKCTHMSLTSLITIAYGIDFYRVVAASAMGPTDMFEISVTVPPDTTRPQFETMLQNLLADRFKLAVHREARPLAEYDLVLAKGGQKLKEAGPPPPVSDGPPAAPQPRQPLKTDQNGFPVFPAGQAGMAVTRDKAHVYRPRMTMPELATLLSGQLRTPVTDGTGLKGQYEIDLFWSTASLTAPADATGAQVETDSGPTLVLALKDELGLTLEKKKGTAEFLIVDHADKLPSEN